MVKRLGLIFVAVTMCIAFGYGQAAAVMQVSVGGVGDELNGLYDVRINGDTGRTSWQNFIVVENTSPRWTAFHLRFRAHKCSIEVWDKVILLSPYDVFWVAIENDGSGGVNMWSTDSDTLVNSALIDAPLGPGESWTDAFSRELMDEIGQDSSLDFGHFEAIGLFQLDFYPNFQGREDTHDLTRVVKDLWPMYDPDGLINVMDVLSAAYYDFAGPDPQRGLGWVTRNPDDLVIDGSETPITGHTRDVLDCPNVLTGNFIWGDLVSAEMGMENMIALEDFRTDDTAVDTLSLIHRDGHFSGAIVFPPNTVNPYLLPDYFNTSPAWYLNPDWATQVGPTLRDGDARLLAGLGDPFPWVCNTGIALTDRFNDIWSHYDVDVAYDKSEFWYNYFQGSPFGAGETYTTDVMLAFKTKYLNSVTCTFPYWNSSGAFTTPGEYYLAVAAARYGLCNTTEICFRVSVWDMEENHPDIPAPEPSPGIWRYPLCLYDETNIMRFSTDQGAMTDPTLLWSPFAMGQFRIGDWYSDQEASVNFNFRYLGDLPGGAVLPQAPAPFGIIYFRHSYGDWVRSAMAELHYNVEWNYVPTPP